MRPRRRLAGLLLDGSRAQGDARVLAKNADPELPTTDTLEAAIKAEWVDLSRVYEAQVITGGSGSVKAVAASVGFSWRADDAGGDLSMVHHAAAVAGDPDSVTWLRTYNEDDVRATDAVREWLRTNVDGLPRIEDWVPPTTV